MRRVASTGLAIARGVAFQGDDRLRGRVIERLLCDFRVSFDELREAFGASADEVVAEMRHYAQHDPDEFLAIVPDGVVVTDRGRPFVRTVASRFDAYLERGAARHSSAV
jgi:oxygen-independent coproporphyrinogen-3 oxidase